MNEQNLTMAGKYITSREQAQEMGRKGGMVSSPAKKLAARLRDLKKKGLGEEDAKILYDMMTSGEVLSLDILIGLKKLYPGLKYDKDKIAYFKTLIDLNKQIHGDKHHITGEMNINKRVVNIHIVPFEEKSVEVRGEQIDGNQMGNEPETARSP